MVELCLCGNSHTKPEMPFYSGLSLPPFQVLSVNQYVKRWETNPKVNWKVYSLEELINGHGKKRVFIREPENPSLKWTFVYATNWDKQKNIPKIRLYDINGEIGKRILDHLFDPASNPLPHINQDGSAMIQGSLFDQTWK